MPDDQDDIHRMLDEQTTPYYGPVDKAVVNEQLRAMTPDALTHLIMREQEAMYPDSDPGDMTITVQDDAWLVEIGQDGWAPAEPVYLPYPGMGHTIHEALINYLWALRDGRLVRDETAANANCGEPRCGCHTGSGERWGDCGVPR